MKFFVYILKTSSDTLYIGQTKDLEKRIKEHREKTSRSAKYMRYFKSFELVYQETLKSRSEALKREAQLKKLTRPEKEKLIQNRDE
jgi:putative endonuclease